jgi:hypothetical protein
MKYIISRFINGISLNEKEYVLEEGNDKVRLFSKKEALDLVGYKTIEDAEEDWIFIEPYNEKEFHL